MPDLVTLDRVIGHTAPLPINLAVAVALLVGAEAIRDVLGASDPLLTLLISMSIGNAALAILTLVTFVARGVVR